MKKTISALFLGLALGANPLLAEGPITSGQIIDLSHTYSAETLYWPTSPSKFEHKELSYGDTDAGFFYSAYVLSTPEHGGTHIDAPIHFYKDRQTVDEIPLENLILPAVVIDISAQAAADRNYRLSVSDISAFEATHGQIPVGSAVLLFTNWDQYWPDAKNYLGDDTPGDASNLSFPSFGAEATALLVKKRGVKMIGLDTASIDYGKSTDFPVHQIVAEANIPALENLTNLAALPPVGSQIIALPMKVKGGSGAPVRVAAILPSP